MNTLTNLEESLKQFKCLFEDTIRAKGQEGKTSLIRSKKHIDILHDAIKKEFISLEVDEKVIQPCLGETKPELKLAGKIKRKNQDICILLDQSTRKKSENLTYGVEIGEKDEYGREYTERILSINVRSQMSSIGKNFDTLFERKIAEAYNLHLRCPAMVLGDVYLIPLKEYDSNAVKEKRIAYKDNDEQIKKHISKYIRYFWTLNNRMDVSQDFHKYERICLLIVDFEPDPIKIYSNDEQLKSDCLIKKDGDISIEGMSWENFASDLLNIYNHRFI